MPKNKKIKNNSNPKKSVSLEEEPRKYDKENIIFDFSFEGAFIACKVKKTNINFNNYLKDIDSFVDNFRILMKNIQNLSQNTMLQILNSNEYTHCHEINGKEKEKALSVVNEIFKKLGKNDNYIDQSIGGEKIYQAGIINGIRVFGTIKDNCFKVYFIDYFHNICEDKNYNDTNSNTRKFCPITTRLD